MIREYLKLARSFNAVLTGISPVMGAIAMQQYDLGFLCILFLIGFLGHSFGFVFNDIIDYRIDKSSEEISDRPLLSGTISLQNAWVFAMFCIVLAFALAIFIAYQTGIYYPIIILLGSAISIIVYDLISKKLPFMDVFVAIGIFLFILYGSATQVQSIYQITDIALIVCVLGSIQVLYMQIVAGGFKDIENDYKKGANTAAVKLGVRVINQKLIVSNSFKIVAYSIQLIDIFLVFLPFLLYASFRSSLLLNIFQWICLSFIALLMLFLSHNLLTMPIFERKQARKYIGSHYMINFALVPILLMSFNPWAGILVFFPALGFVLSNIILHKTILQPKTM